MIDIIFRLASGTRRLEIKATALFVDHIMELEPLLVDSGDSLEVTWNMSLIAGVNGLQTDKKPIKFKKLLKFTESETIKYARLLKYKKDIKILTYSELPKDLKERYENAG